MQTFFSQDGLKKVLKKVLIILILILLTAFVYYNLSVFMPILLAFLTALILEPIVLKIKKYTRTTKRLPAVTITFVLFVCFNAALFYLAITKLVHEAIKFITRLPYYVAEMNLLIDALIQQYHDAVSHLPPLFVIEIQRQGDLAYEKTIAIGREVIPFLATWVQAIPNFLVLSLIFLILLFLISLDLPRIIEGFYSYFKEENATKVSYMSRRLGNVFTGFFKAQFLVSLIIMAASYIGLLIISPKNALIMTLIIWIIDVIPFIGSIVILAPWALFCFISSDISTGIGLSILAAILLIIRRTVEPKIMGDQIGLSPLPTLISIYLGFTFLGVLGLIVGPLFFIAFKSAVEAGIINTDFKI